MQLNRETLDALNSSLERQHSLNQNVNMNTFSLQGLMSMYIWYNVYSVFLVSAAQDVPPYLGAPAPHSVGEVHDGGGHIPLLDNFGRHFTLVFYTESQL